jgi:hypothetical protein
VKGMLISLASVVTAGCSYSGGAEFGKGNGGILVKFAPSVGDSSTRAGRFRAPSHIREFDQDFVLAFTSDKDGRDLYEYTAGNESVDDWKTLISIIYAKETDLSPLQWGKAFTKSVAMDTPHYSVWATKDNGYARVIYEPNSQFAGYEVDAFRTYHLSACKGLVSLQYAIRPDVADASDNDPEAKHELLLKLAAQSKTLADRIENSGWSPDCSRK